MASESSCPDPVVRPRVLVLMATYNGVEWLEEQIESVLAQEGIDVVLEINDDASKDGTVALIMRRWGSDPRVRVRAGQESSGSAGANFRSLYRQADVADFDFVALADQDDVWLKCKLRHAIDCLSREQAECYSGAVCAFGDKVPDRTLSQCDRIRAGDFLFEGAGQGCTFIVKKEFFQRVQLFCREHAEAVERLHYHDWLLYLLARTWQAAWYFDPKPCMRYRQHEGNEIGARGSLGAFRRRFAMIRNGWFVRQVRSAGVLYQLAGGNDPVVNHLIRQMQSGAPTGLLRRIELTRMAFHHGRRRSSDRVVLGVAALMGWLS